MEPCAPFLSTADRKSDPNSHGTPSEVDIHNFFKRFFCCLVAQEWHWLIHLIPSIYIYIICISKKFGSKRRFFLRSLTNLPGIKMNPDGYKQQEKGIKPQLRWQLCSHLWPHKCCKQPSLKANPTQKETGRKNAGAGATSREFYIASEKMQSSVEQTVFFCLIGCVGSGV